MNVQMLLLGAMVALLTEAIALRNQLNRMEKIMLENKADADARADAIDAGIDALKQTIADLRAEVAGFDPGKVFTLSEVDAILSRVEAHLAPPTPAEV